MRQLFVDRHSEESQLVLYSLVLYTIEHSPEELPPEVQSHLVQLVISTSASRQIVLYQALVQVTILFN